ncbi:MAG TPA: hypothetical protein VE984_12290 [Gaiellaceae bacterium]|nr:hypothetical protein [Gaiellaceae bacterium]
MKTWTGAALLAATALAAPACGSGYQASASHNPGQSQGSVVHADTVSSTGLILGGRVRCTATVSRSVQAGDDLGLTFLVRNVSDRSVRVPLTGGGLWLVVKAADGTTYDTRVPLRNEIGPLVGAPEIAPGATKRVPWVGKYLRVRWGGPLTITPGCGQTALPVLRVGVESPGPPADDRTALAAVVAASGHLLDHCRPEQDDVAVQGQIDSPDGKAPPMSATCSVSLQPEGNFVVAQALIASPAGLGDVHLDQPYEQLSVKHAPTFETVAWEFVVTKDGATSVAAAEADATKPADRMAPDWTWTSTGGGQRPGSSRCGGSGGSWGWAGPTVEFVSVCPA